MGERFRAGLHAWLLALDALIYVTFAWPLHVVGLAERPSPYETISSVVGRRANAGANWAFVGEHLIDLLFIVVAGSQPGHCQRSIVRADWIISTLP